MTTVCAAMAPARPWSLVRTTAGPYDRRGPNAADIVRASRSLPIRQRWRPGMAVSGASFLFGLRTTAHRFAVAVALFFTLAACSTANTGKPVFESSRAPSRPTTSVSPTSTAPSSTTRLLPPRPRDLDLTSIDPCKDVLTQDQLRQLAYDLGYERAPEPGHAVIDDGRTCTYSSSRPTDQPSRDIGSLVIISVTAGAEVWLTDPSRKRSSNLARKTTVAGFPVLVLPHPSIVDNCGVVVDVHDDQYLEVDSSPRGGAKGTSPDPYCAEAQRVAGLIVQNLSARK